MAILSLFWSLQQVYNIVWLLFDVKNVMHNEFMREMSGEPEQKLNVVGCKNQNSELKLQSLKRVERLSMNLFKELHDLLVKSILSAEKIWPFG